MRLSEGSIDWHSHILPAVDDGVRSMDDALAILRRYEAAGIAEVWLTPHIMEDIPNETAALRERFAELLECYTGTVRLHLSAENMLDNLFEERLEQRDLLPIGDAGDRLLVETSYFNPPMDLVETLRRIKSSGYIPVLAHPERYIYMDRGYYRRLRSEGVEFQLNIASFAGVYGRHAREKAEWLHRNGLFEFTGSDIHNTHMIEQFLN